MPKTKKQFVWMPVYKRTGIVFTFVGASKKNICQGRLDDYFGENMRPRIKDFVIKKFELREVKNAKRNA